MIKKSILVCALVLVSIVAGFSQSGEIRGVLFDKTTGQGFAAVATIFFPALEKGTSSDMNGNFLIEKVPAGTYQLKIECIGYRDTSMQVEIQPYRTTTLAVNFPIGCHVLNQKGNTCPYCQKSDAAIPILYGLPDKEGMKLAKRGRLWLGGCNITGCDPQWYCKKDKKEF